MTEGPTRKHYYGCHNQIFRGKKECLHFNFYELVANEPAERRRSAGEVAENNHVCRKILDQAMKV